LDGGGAAGVVVCPEFGGVVDCPEGLGFWLFSDAPDVGLVLAGAGGALCPDLGCVFSAPAGVVVWPRAMPAQTRGITNNFSFIWVPFVSPLRGSKISLHLHQHVLGLHIARLRRFLYKLRQSISVPSLTSEPRV